ncbi:uncharacterized protein KY384_000438 [Bacidia gigantensis]|uniref:uncharacterized protein n=1 Tax=Bacidia gigantensis TaxID=2732470 RepID=UPI001D047863|nr:uncharacterized protein KY384_000438 [Bacidia gigantensis]KAG8525678.1 hypothetical protein KY384_000438 [Bacidia gigantensis]
MGNLSFSLVSSGTWLADSANLPGALVGYGSPGSLYSLSDALDITPSTSYRSVNITDYESYLFLDSCNFAGNEYDCYSACDDNAFDSLYSLHNCVATSLLVNSTEKDYNITNADSPNVMAIDGPSTTSYLVTKDPEATAKTATGRVWGCLSEECTKYPTCKNVLRTLNTTNIETARVPTNEQKVYVSYWIHGSLALLIFFASFGLKYLAPWIFARRNRASKKTGKNAKVQAQEHLSHLVSAMSDFQKAQCFFMVAINIAAIKVQRQGGLDPQTLQQIYNNYLFLKLIAVSGYLPITFTLFNLHLLNMTSWYLIVLSGCCIVFAIATLGVLGTFKPTDFDLQDLATFAAEGGSEECLTKQIWAYCYEPLGSDSSYSPGYTSSDGGNVDTMAWRILAFCLVIMIFLITSQARLRHRPPVRRLFRWIWSEILSLARHTRYYAGRPQELLMRMRFMQRLVAKIKIDGPQFRDDAKDLWLWIWQRTPGCRPITSRWHAIRLSKAWMNTSFWSKVAMKRIEHEIKGQILLTRQKAEKVGHATLAYKVFKFCIYVTFIAIYLDFFALFMTDLAWFASNNVYNNTWNFGQVVALTVWAPPIAEYIHLEFRGMRRGFDHKLLPPYRLTRRALTMSSSTLDLERAAIATIQLTPKPRPPSTNGSDTRVVSTDYAYDDTAYHGGGGGSRGKAGLFDEHRGHGEEETMPLSPKRDGAVEGEGYDDAERGLGTGSEDSDRHSSDSDTMQETSPLKTSIDDTVWQLPEPQFPSRSFSFNVRGYDRI